MIDALALAQATIERLAKTDAQRASVRGTLDVIAAESARQKAASVERFNIRFGIPEDLREHRPSFRPDGAAYMNGQRAQIAETIMKAWLGERHGTENESAIQDCISDLLHLAHSEGQDSIQLRELVENAVSNFVEEAMES